MNHRLQIRIILPLFLFNLLISGCAGVHVFNSTNTPCLTNAGQGNLNIYPGRDHVEVQVAVSPAKHFGFFANAYESFLLGKDPSYDSRGTCFLEGAVGYYSSLNKSNEESRWFYDLYAGFGNGQRVYNGSSAFLAEDDYTVYTSYDKGFIQGSLFYIHNRSQLAFGFQPSLLYYNVMSTQVLGLRGNSIPNGGNTWTQNRFTVFNANLSVTYKLRIVPSLSFISQFAMDLSSFQVPNYPQVPSGYSGGVMGGYRNLPYNGRPVGINCGIQFTFQ
ncbi:MAG: hypothetical protein ACHQRM_17230 [Bacteroidia bacterium]